MNDRNLTFTIVVAAYLSPDGQHLLAGGRPRIVRDLARYFAARDYEVTIIQRGTLNIRIPHEPNISVRIVRTPARAWADLLFSRKIREEVRRATVCCYATPEDGFPFESPNAFAIQHGVWWDSPQYSAVKRVIIHAVQRLRNYAMCRRTKAVICVDSNFANILRLGGPKGHRLASKCLYLPNYVDLDAFPAPTPGRLLQRFRSRKLLFLRRLEAERGTRFFVEVCKLLRDEGVTYTAELCGWGRELQMIEALIAGHRLESHVRLSDGTLEDAVAVANTATISVVPSQWSEGTSLSAVESIALGIPVIATDIGGLPNVVISGFNGYICPRSTNTFAVHIRKLLENEDEYIRLANNCLTLRDAFSFDRWATTLTTHLAEQGIVPAMSEGRRSSEAT